MAVAGDDLRGDRLGPQAELGQHLGFEIGGQCGVGPHRARELAEGALLDRAAQAFLVAAALKGISGDLQPEAGGLGMHAVGAPHRDGVAMGERQIPQGAGECGLLLDQERAGAGDRQAERGIEDIGGGHAVVDPARGRSDMFGDIGQERYDIVVGRLLELLGAFDAECGLRLDFGEVCDGNDPTSCPRAAHRQLDLEPPSELGVFDPDRRHCGP